MMFAHKETPMSQNSFEFTTIIESVGSLDELLAAWIANREQFEKSDCTELPTFGGNEPEDTLNVWSWDDSRILTGASFDDLSIENRCKREEVAR